MILGCYVVRDHKVEFLTPTFDVNDESAIRNFAYAINNGNGLMGFAAADFDLFKIGTFDSKKGFLDKSEFPVPLLICSGSSILGAKVGDSNG